MVRKDRFPGGYLQTDYRKKRVVYLMEGLRNTAKLPWDPDNSAGNRVVRKGNIPRGNPRGNPGGRKSAENAGEEHIPRFPRGTPGTR